MLLGAINALAAGGGGTVTGLTVIATRAALGMVTGQAAGDTRFLNEAGREGVFIYKLGDYASRVTADTRGGIFVAASGIATNVGAWVRVYGFPINLGWFGLAGDGTTDDLPAFDAALATIKTLASVENRAAFKVAPALYVPKAAKHYYLSNTLNIHCIVHMFGDGSGAPNERGTALRFAPNCNGIVLNDYRTNGDGLGSQGDSSGSIIEGFWLDGGNVGYNSGTGAFVLGNASSTSGHGIRIRSTGCTVRDIGGQLWGGSLIDISASSGSGGVNEGNANNWTVRNVWGFYNDGSTLNIAGTDSNTGTSENVNGIQNRIACINDRSFLGNNTHITPHARDNGVVCSTGNNLPTGMSKVGAQCYIVIQGQETAASTTTPGTNSAVWLASGTSPYAVTWVSGMTWAAGGPYLTSQTNFNSVSLFLNAYAESAQGPSQGQAPARFIGGLLLASGGVIGGATWDRAVSGALVANSFSADSATGGGTPTMGGGSLFGASDGSTYAHTLKVYSAAGSVAWKAANGGSQPVIVAFNTYNDTFGSTLVAARLRVAAFNSFDASGGGYGLNFITAPTDIAAGDYLLKGDRYYRANPTAGQNEGWIVTGASGPAGATPATKMTPFGYIGGIGYAAGQGGTVTQATSKATGVTLSALCGQITLNAASLAANTVVSFTFTNSQIAATDVIRINIAGGVATPGSYIVQAEAIAAPMFFARLMVSRPSIAGRWEYVSSPPGRSTITPQCSGPSVSPVGRRLPAMCEVTTPQ